MSAKAHGWLVFEPLLFKKIFRCFQGSVAIESSKSQVSISARVCGCVQQDEGAHTQTHILSYSATCSNARTYDLLHETQACHRTPDRCRRGLLRDTLSWHANSFLNLSYHAWGWVLSTLVYSLKPVPLPVLSQGTPSSDCRPTAVILFIMELLRGLRISACLMSNRLISCVSKACHQSHDNYVLQYLLSCRCLRKKPLYEALSEALIPPSRPNITAVVNVMGFFFFKGSFLHLCYVRVFVSAKICLRHWGICLWGKSCRSLLHCLTV